MKKTLTVIIVLLGATSAFAQNNVTLTFTCQTTDGGYLQPDSITIENLTRNWSETLYYPDTVYILNVGTSVPNRLNDNGMQMMPNPFDGTTRVNVQSPKTENVKMTLTDMGGRVCAKFSGQLQEGGNLFTIALTTPQTYLLSVQTSSGIHSLKMENTGRAGANRIAYEGATGSNMPMVQLKSSSSHPFQLGDELRYQGFATNFSNVVVSQTVTQMQSVNESIVLVFPDWGPSNGDGQPCPSTLTVSDIVGNIYNTVQIGDQCWMHENLRTTKFADGTNIPAGNSVSYHDPYRYNYNTSDIPLEERGYLYNWFAVMHGANSSDANPSGVQGICPIGWHVPSDSEWSVLANYLSSQSAYLCGGDTENIAKALASTLRWRNDDNCETCDVGYNQSTNNAAGFCAIPTGYWHLNFGNAGGEATFWSATECESGDAYHRNLNYNYPDVYRFIAPKNYAFPVRCLRD